ncbi:HPr family phosphocarrier protein [Streptomyces sp. NBC_00388]|uniref:HPr family phosphocarrier protein n=1 Tax=Streptomyces sp. NBC_00388 TaxID=2975735 RepID=UPI002E1AA769
MQSIPDRTSGEPQPVPGMPATVTSWRLPVVLPSDLHARPAGRIATAAPLFRAETRLEHRGRSAAAPSILAVMGLGARAGSSVDVVADGPDARAAAEAIAEILGTAG